MCRFFEQVQSRCQLRISPVHSPEVLQSKDAGTPSAAACQVVSLLAPAIVQAQPELFKRSRVTTMKYFEDHTEAEVVYYPGEYPLTEADIIRVAKKWDPQPFHIDKQAAEQSFFKGLVACSTHLYGISNILFFSLDEPLATVSSLGSTDVINHNPAYAGDILKVRSTCKSTRLSESKPSLGILEYFVELYNQNKVVVSSYTNSALYRLRPAHD
ncbi:MAG: acyl dehydratase [Bacteroidia bacterium]|jgi:acyl dehydratase